MIRLLNYLIAITLLLPSSIYLTGCQTYGEAAGLGAAIGG